MIAHPFLVQETEPLARRTADDHIRFRNTRIASQPIFDVFANHVAAEIRGVRLKRRLVVVYGEDTFEPSAESRIDESEGHAAGARAQEPAGVPGHAAVTIEAHKGKEPPVINREDVMVHVGRDRDPVVDWVPAQGEHAALELMILLDGGLNTTLGTQLDDLRKFISSQPDTTTVGVAYMRDGVAQVVQNLTSDHSLAAKALRLPLLATINLEFMTASGSRCHIRHCVIHFYYPHVAFRHDHSFPQAGPDCQTCGFQTAPLPNQCIPCIRSIHRLSCRREANLPIVALRSRDTPAGPETLIGRYVDVEGGVKNEVQTTATHRR